MTASEARESPTGVRPGCLLAAGLFALGAVAVVAVVALQGREDGRIVLGSTGDVPAGSVVYYATRHAFVVGRQGDGSVLVLSDVDPHNPPGRPVCRVTFRPDLGDGADARGRFFDVCSGAMYDIEGRGLQGDGLDLRRLEFEVDTEGRISIAANDAVSRAGAPGQIRGVAAA